MKLDTSEPYDAFNERVARVRTELPALLRDLKSKGKVIYGYGASTKGNVTLQYCNIGPDLITAIADRNPAKWGQVSPGMNIPICSEDEMRAARPDYLLALPWPFLSAFMERESAFLARGGKFIVPMPEVKIEPSSTAGSVSYDRPSSTPSDIRSSKKRALITGVAGQDGTYLATLLLSKGYEVIGLDAPGRAPRTELTRHVELDLSDTDRLAELLNELRPDECYHLAAFHRSSSAEDGASRGDREHAFIETNLLSTHAILKTLASVHPDCRVFLAGSCHMFGHASETPQSERTPFAPTNMYGITKNAAMHLGGMYRAKGMHVCTGILYNHESPLRDSDFITAKIARAAVDISRGAMDQITIGNLDVWVDWGFAGDYVEAMHLMLQAKEPEDFIIASGELHRIRDFVEIAFSRVGLDWRSHVREDASAYRPVSRTVYQGDASAIRNRLGWEPKTSFKELVEMMVDHYIDPSVVS